MTTATEILRSIPAVSRLIEGSAFSAAMAAYGRSLVVETIQSRLLELRQQIQQSELDEEGLHSALERLPGDVREALDERFSSSLRSVINATGVLIHTNAGRAPLSTATAQEMADLACGYSNLEYDLALGERGRRDQHFEGRVRRLLGCQAATVCNNNAAAVFLILNTLAAGKKVVVSRGELVEIGGSFRIPEIMTSAGARLCEVGTTNKTRISDYRNAVDEETALILRVHPSNYRITGFTQVPRLEELVELSQKSRIPLVKDAGSGLLFDSDHPALCREPSVDRAIRSGVDLVCFSGDKLMGGPQSGLIVGRQDLLQRIRKNPLMRVLRVDKITYRALESTLIAYEKGTAIESIPIHQMLHLSVDSLRRRCEQLSQALPRGTFRTELVEDFSVVGGGSAPEERIATCLLALESPDRTASQLEAALRNSHPPILARIADGRLLLDLRTVADSQDGMIAAALVRLSEDPAPGRADQASEPA